MNLGQTLGETFALVQVPEVKGARLRSFSNVETTGNGYAVLPYVQAYRINWVSLDTRQLGADVDLGSAITQVVPRRGAVPVVRFKAPVGRRVQFELVLGDGSRLPLGASVEDERARPRPFTRALGRQAVSGRVLAAAQRPGSSLRACAGDMPMSVVTGWRLSLLFLPLTVSMSVEGAVALTGTRLIFDGQYR